MYNALLKKVNHDQKKKKREENRLSNLITRKGKEEEEKRKKDSLPEEAKDYTKILEPLAAYMLEVGPEKSRRIRIVGAVEKTPEPSVKEESIKPESEPEVEMKPVVETEEKVTQTFDSYIRMRLKEQRIKQK